MKAVYTLILTVLIVPGTVFAAPEHTMSIADSNTSVGSGSGVEAPGGCEWVDFNTELEFTPQNTDIEIGDIHFKIKNVDTGEVFWDRGVIGTLSDYQELSTPIESEVVTITKPCPFLGSNHATSPPREEKITLIEDGDTDVVNTSTRVSRSSMTPDGQVLSYQMVIVGYAYEYENIQSETSSAPSHDSSVALVQSSSEDTMVNVKTTLNQTQGEPFLVYHEIRRTSDESLIYYNVIPNNNTGEYNSWWSGATQGEYRVDVGIFAPDWLTTHEWTHNATQIVVLPKKQININEVLMQFEDDPNYGVIVELIELFISLGII